MGSLLRRSGGCGGEVGTARERVGATGWREEEAAHAHDMRTPSRHSLLMCARHAHALAPQPAHVRAARARPGATACSAASTCAAPPLAACGDGLQPAVLGVS